MNNLKRQPAKKDLPRPALQFSLLRPIQELALGPAHKQYNIYLESIQRGSTGDAKDALWELKKLAGSPIYRQTARSYLSKIIYELEKEAQATGKESCTAETLRTEALSYLIGSMTDRHDARRAIKQYLSTMTNGEQPLVKLMRLNNFLADMLLKPEDAIKVDLSIISLGICEGAAELLHSAYERYKKTDEYAFRSLSTDAFLSQIEANLKASKQRIGVLQVEFGVKRKNVA